MLLKIVFTTLVIVCVWALSTKLRSKNKQNSPPSQTNTKTVKCQVCGVYIPMEQAIEETPDVYLCEQHRT